MLANRSTPTGMNGSNHSMDLRDLMIFSMSWKNPMTFTTTNPLSLGISFLGRILNKVIFELYIFIGIYIFQGPLRRAYLLRILRLNPFVFKVYLEEIVVFTFSVSLKPLNR